MSCSCPAGCRTTRACSGPQAKTRSHNAGGCAAPDAGKRCGPYRTPPSRSVRPTRGERRGLGGLARCLLRSGAAADPRLTWILEQPPLTPASPVAEASIPLFQASGPQLRWKDRGDLAVREQAMVQTLRPALTHCLTRDHDAPDPAGQGGHDSTTAPPVPRCSRAQRTGPCGGWLDSVGALPGTGCR